jgi:catechol 2,3-dioxygenase-like lactoylglutathione lyase family enzyme
VHREDATAGAEVRRLALGLLPDASSVSARITERVLRIVPELAPAGAPEAVAVVRESTDQNIGAMLSTLAFGITPTTIEPPTGTQDLLRNLTAEGADITHLLRAYRIGHQLLWQLWSEHVHAHISDPAILPAVLQISSAHVFEFIDRACQRIVDSAPSALSSGRVGGRGLGDRPGLVRRLLASDPIDLVSASGSLGYDLSRHHVALLVAPLAEAADPRRELDPLIAAASVPAFALPSTDGSWWAWLGFPASPAPERLARIGAVAVTAVLVGMGEPARGRDGFRRSLAQAREAERVGRLAQSPAPAILRHRDVELAGLLCADPDRARTFAAERLGALAGRDETGRRLRATVRALLDHAHNRGQAAAALHVHQKTVAYRIHQAEELLGHPLTQHGHALAAALLIDHTLNGP